MSKKRDDEMKAAVRYARDNPDAGLNDLFARFPAPKISAPSSCSLSSSQVGLSLNTQPLDNDSEWANGIAGESLLALILCAIGNAGKRRKR